MPGESEEPSCKTAYPQQLNIAHAIEYDLYDKPHSGCACQLRQASLTTGHPHTTIFASGLFLSHDFSRPYRTISGTFLR